MTVALGRQQTLQQWQLAPTEWRPCSLQTDRRSTQSVLSSSTATRSRCSDPAYIDQLKQWLRFSCTDAVRSRDGLFSATTGNLVVPAILGGSLFALVATADSENKKSLAQIASSSGLAILFPSRTTRLTGRPPVAPTSALRCRQWRWVSNMPSSTKRSKWRLCANALLRISLGERRPDLIVRFGYAAEMPLRCDDRSPT